jgi:sugar phosphate isomerase/epimerase
MYSRRDFGKMTLAGWPLASALAEINSTVDGVRLGVQTYSFRDFDVSTFADRVTKTMADIGLGECELQFPRGRMDGGRGQTMDAAARKAAAEEARKQRLTIPLDYYRQAGKKFKDSGIEVFAYNAMFVPADADQDLDREFEIAKDVGAQIVASSTTLSVAKRLAPLAENHKMLVALHGHSGVAEPDQFATPDSFAAGLAMSKYFRTNLDIGHFWAAGYDPVAFIQEHHNQITHIHLKDRRKNQGPNTPWGEGDTPIKPVLQLLKQMKYPMRAYIEYEYRGSGTSPEEVRKCFDYCKAALA